MKFNLGVCQIIDQNAFGKTLETCIWGYPPYIKTEPLGGSDMLILEIFAKKFNFSSNYKVLENFPESVRK